MGWCSPPCPAACSGPVSIHGTSLSLAPGPMRAVGRKVPMDPGRAAVLIQKRAWPGRGGRPRRTCGEESASCLLRERGRKACRWAGWGACSGKKQGTQNGEKACVFSGEAPPGCGWAHGFSSNPKRGNPEECSSAREAASAMAALPAWWCPFLCGRPSHRHRCQVSPAA